MLKTVQILGQKYLRDEVSFFFYSDSIFLKSKDKKGDTLLAKSKDGFSFVQTKENAKLARAWEDFSSHSHQQNKKYKAIIEKHLDKAEIGNLDIEGVFPWKRGMLLIFHFKTETASARVSAFLFSRAEHPALLWNAVEAVYETPSEWNQFDLIFLNLVKLKDRFIAYWRVEGLGIFAVCYPSFCLGKKIAVKINRCRLQKSGQNPIIKAKSQNSWEAFNTFNPAALYEADKVHLFYRAQGYDYYSSVGYAVSKDGVHIDERLDDPVFKPTEAFEKNTRGKANRAFISGGGYGGCEDPRVTKIDKRLYMTYVAFDGWHPPRLALTSISLTDFLARKWLWEKPVLISPPGVVDKSGCILPEKINGKYVIFHRIFPDILIDYVDSLDFDGSNFLTGQYKISPRSREWWDSRKIGVGAPPLKTKDGWLLIYQAVDDKNDSIYQIGAMLLDLKNPSRVLYRSSEPILKPDKFYERDGFKAGVVYPCGAVIIKDTLFVYYGAADSYVSVATAKLNSFLDSLKLSRVGHVLPAYIRGLH